MLRKEQQVAGLQARCSPCCHGIFAINQLDAIRLRKDWRRWKSTTPSRAGLVRRRALDTVTAFRDIR
jgi:hypothetical protein